MERRSTRKRKQVDYKEPAAFEKEWLDDGPKKKKKGEAKMKAAAKPASKPKLVINLNEDDGGNDVGGMKEQVVETATVEMNQQSVNTAKAKRKRSQTNASGEKRKKPYRGEPSDDYLKLMDRALTQRLFVLDRMREGSDDGPTETVSIAGSTGNVYTVKINHMSSCNCPHFLFRRNQCKHILYVMHLTLKAPEELCYQTALLSSELREIFDNAPQPIVPELVDTSNDGNRKPIEDDCPICCMEFNPEQEEIVWCKAACGNNLHKQCFDRWAKSKRDSYSKVTCPYCRSEWVENKSNSVLKGIQNPGRGLNYVNVATHLGYWNDE